MIPIKFRPPNVDASDISKSYKVKLRDYVRINLEIYESENMPKIEAAEVAQNIETIFISFFSLLYIFERYSNLYFLSLDFIFLDLDINITKYYKL